MASRNARSRSRLRRSIKRRGTSRRGLWGFLGVMGNRGARGGRFSAGTGPWSLPPGDLIGSHPIDPENCLACCELLGLVLLDHRRDDPGHH